MWVCNSVVKISKRNSISVFKMQGLMVRVSGGGGGEGKGVVNF